MTYPINSKNSAVEAAPCGRPRLSLLRTWCALWLATLVAACAPAPAPPEPEATAPVEAPPAAPPEVKFATPKEIRAVIDAERGNVIVMNFWATWCPPCVKEMPELAKFYREFDGHGVRFLSISADHPSTKDSKVVPFVKSYEIPFPVRVGYLDNPDELLEALPLAWENRPWDGALPATFIFDKEGTLAWSTVGEVDRDLLAEKVKPLLDTTP